MAFFENSFLPAIKSVWDFKNIAHVVSKTWTLEDKL